MTASSYKFELPSHHKSIIKVIGVGGGGSNAVNHMYDQGIKDVEFVVCNTDVQALHSSPVPTKLQIGMHLTQGLGCGANPETGRNAAMESKEEIREFLSDNTKMVFITAGMGGGTGTGAAPVIARIAKELDILTVGIVTQPFSFEGRKKLQAGMNGIAELKQNCDTVLVILNDKLFEVNADLSIREAFAQADNVLTTAAKSIAEIITVTSHVNVDFEDVKTVMKNSGAAVMGSAVASGSERAMKAVQEAISSPLLDNTDIFGAKKILLSMSFGDKAELTVKELNLITSYIEEQAGDDADVIWGEGVDAELGESLRVTVIATGFEHATTYLPPKRTVFDLEKDQNRNEPAAPAPQTSSPVQNDFLLFQRPELKKEEPRVEPVQRQELRHEEPKAVEPPKERIVYSLDYGMRKEEESKQTEAAVNAVETSVEKSDDTEEKKRLLLEQSRQRIQKLKGLNSTMNFTPDEFKDKLEIPAYQRRNVNLKDHPHSSENKISRLNLNEDNEILGNNRFLHDNVD